MSRKAYQSDRSNQQWQFIHRSFLQLNREVPRSVDLGEVVHAIFEVLRTGCGWEIAP